MNSEEKIQIQIQVIKNLNDKVKELTQTVEELEEENRILKMPLSEKEKVINETFSDVNGMIETYKNLIDEAKRINEEVKIYRDDYMKYYKQATDDLIEYITDEKKMLHNMKGG